MPRLSLVRRPSYLVPLALSLVPQPSSLLFAQRPDAKMSFFITSRGPGDGANLGGLEGADRHCSLLAVMPRRRRAYLPIAPPRPTCHWQWHPRCAALWRLPGGRSPTATVRC